MANNSSIPLPAIEFVEVIHIENHNFVRLSKFGAMSMLLNLSRVLELEQEERKTRGQETFRIGEKSPKGNLDEPEEAKDDAKSNEHEHKCRE